ncbi:MAG: DNA-3-methyladenine glycosylase family protein [Thermoleophilaceae bacterium]
MVALEQDVRPPPGPFRLRAADRDGVMRRRDGVLTRLIHHGDEPAVVRAWPVAGAVRVQAEAPSRDAAAFGIERIRFALNVDHDLRPFRTQFKRDPLLGPIVRRMPWIRPWRAAQPFQALAWAVTEQLIETEHAWEIQRRLAFRYGRRSTCGTLVDAPSADTLAGRCQPELQACDLSAGRSRALIEAARGVARGRIDLDNPEDSRRRLIRIRGIGPWTVEKLGLHGQGDDDQLPAGDLAYIKLVGRLAGLGRRAEVHEVREFFAPYEPFRALAGVYMLVGAHSLAGPSDRPPLRRGPRPRRPGARAPRL